MTIKLEFYVKPLVLYGKLILVIIGDLIKKKLYKLQSFDYIIFQIYI